MPLFFPIHMKLNYNNLFTIYIYLLLISFKTPSMNRSNPTPSANGFMFGELYMLKQIERGMAHQKQLVEQYIDEYEISSSWDKIKKGFIYRGIETKLSRLVKLVPCDINSTHSIYLLPQNPSEKIYVCYNKIESYADLSQQLTRKLLMAYDLIARKVDFRNLRQLARSEIKAINLSQTCLRNDKECFNKKIEEIMKHQEQFKGKKSIFDEVFDEAIHDVEPMNELKF